jgi:hypothetical protein
MKTGIVTLGQIRQTKGLVFTAEHYLLTEEEMRQALLAYVDNRLKPLVMERAAIQAAEFSELRRRYANRFWMNR